MDTVFKARLRELQDRQDIEECVSRYAHGLDRHDEALIAAAYHPDAVDRHGPFDGPIPEFVTWVNALHERKTRAHTHNITTHWCELQGDRAFADSYVIFVLYLRDRDIVMMGSGRYVDRLERRAGAWKIAERRVIIDMRLEVPSQPLPDTPGGYPVGTWDRSDITYLRPLVLPSELESVRVVGSGRAQPPQRFAANDADIGMAGGGGAPALLARLAARRAIKDCIVQSVRGLDRADRSLVLEQFSRGAVVEDGSFRGDVEAHVDEQLTRFAAEDVVLTHNVTSHLVELRGAVAAAETYVMLMRFSKDRATAWVGGVRLLDRLARDGHDEVAGRRDGPSAGASAGASTGAATAAGAATGAAAGAGAGAGAATAAGAGAGAGVAAGAGADFGDRWRITSRTVVADYEFAADGAAMNVDDQYLRSTRDVSDISYDRR